MKSILTLALLTTLSTAAFGQQSYQDKFFAESNNPRLNTQDRKGLAIADTYSPTGRMAVPPVASDSGRVTFTYGTNPSVVCAVMRVCDIALQPGEQVNSINAGDTARWNIEPAVSGSGDSERLHVLVKPLDVGLTTNLFIATNRRTYNITLKSHKTRYMPAVGFAYPEETAAKWRALQTSNARRHEAQVMATGENINNLDFNYSISGDSPKWKPVRVYNDNVRTIIQMPSTLSQGEAPTLLVIRDGETTLVNYRLQGDRYIVDTLFDQAIMVTGVGRKQTKVVIKRSAS